MLHQTLLITIVLTITRSMSTTLETDYFQIDKYSFINDVLDRGSDNSS